MFGAPKVHRILRQGQTEIIPGIVRSGDDLAPRQLPDLREAAQQAGNPLGILNRDGSSQIVCEGDGFRAFHGSWLGLRSAAAEQA